MPFDGSGNFALPAPETPFISGTPIEAADMNTVMEDIAQALSICLTRDSQATPTTSFNFGNQRGINVGAPLAATDVATRGFVLIATVDRDMAGFRILNVPNVPAALTDAVNGNFVVTAQGDRSMAGYRLNGLPATPATGDEAVSRDYVLGLSNNLPTQSAATTSEVISSNGATAAWTPVPAIDMYAYQNFGGF